jgi:hypothetical protein
MHRRWAALLLVLCLPMVAGACGGDDPSKEGKSVADPDAAAAPCASTTTVAAGDIPAAVPAGLRPAPGDTVTRAAATGGASEVEVTTTQSVDDVFHRYKAALAGAGFKVDKEDDEGREAELYFSNGSRKGSVLITRTNCPPGATRYKLTVPD